MPSLVMKSMEYVISSSTEQEKSTEEALKAKTMQFNNRVGDERKVVEKTKRVVKSAKACVMDSAGAPPQGPQDACGAYKKSKDCGSKSAKKQGCAWSKSEKACVGETGTPGGGAIVGTAVERPSTRERELTTLGISAWCTNSCSILGRPTHYLHFSHALVTTFQLNKFGVST